MPRRFPPIDFSNAPEPPFHTLDATAFEILCRDLGYSLHRDAVQFGLYEDKGVKQYGADWYLEFEDGSMIIGSCKAHENPGRDVIVGEAADDIEENWAGYWADKNVKMVALCFAADSRQGARRDNMRDARQQIEALGVRCEVWSRERLTNDLQGFPALVSRHLGSDWVRKLCERMLPPTNRGEFRAARPYAEQLTAFEEGQYTLMEETIERLRERMRGGDEEGVRSTADEIIQSPQWLTLSDEQKADILRLKASTFVFHEVETAETLAREARGYFLPPDRFLDVLVATSKEGPAIGLDELSEPRTVRERHLKAALLIELSQPDEAMALIGCEPEQSAVDEDERLRLRAIAATILRLDTAAIEAARQLEARKSHWPAGRRACLIARYFATISAALPVKSFDWPEPMPTGFCKDDPASHRLRMETISALRAQIDTAVEQEERTWLSVWRLALLCDCDGRREDAQAALDEALVGEAFHPAVVVWGVARRLEMKVPKVTPRLKELADSGDPTAAAVLVAFRLSRGRIRDARRTVETYRETIARLGEGIAEHWEREVQAAGRPPRRRRGARQRSHQVVQRGQVDDAASVLTDEGAFPVKRYLAAETLAENSAWEELWQGKDFLVEKVATADAFYLAALAASHVLSADDARGFLATPPEVENEASLSWIGEMRIRLLADAGDLATAIREAQQVLTNDAHPSFLMLADLSLRVGDLASAASTVERALRGGNPALNSDESRLQWARILRRSSPSVARQLIESGGEADAPRLASLQLDLALELFEDRGPVIEQAFIHAAEGENAPIRRLSVEEVRELWIEDLKATEKRSDRYEEGYLPGHLMFGEKLGLAYLGTSVEPPLRQRPTPHAFHARRSVESTADVGRVLLDVSAILTVHALDLWEHLRDSLLTIFLPHHWALTLTSFQQTADVLQPTRFVALEKAVQSITAGEVRVTRSRPVGSRAIRLDASTAGSDCSPENGLNACAPGSRYFLDIGVLVELHRSGRFADYSDCSTLVIDADERIRLSDELSQLTTQRRVAEKIEELIRQLRQLILDGQLFVAPNPYEVDEAIGGNWAEQGLLQGLRQADNLDAAYWIDDRFVNGHGQTENQQVISTIDMIDQLTRHDRISVIEARRVRDRLRQLDVQFVLPTADEIIATMVRARSGRNSAKQALRRMSATFHRFGIRLKAGPDEIEASRIWEDPAEVQMLLLLNRVIGGLLATDELTDDTVAECAVEALYFFSAEPCVDRQSDKYSLWREKFVVSYSLALTACFQPQTFGDDNAGRRTAKVIKALIDHAIDPSVGAWPELADTLFERLGEALTSTLDGGDDELERRFRLAATGSFIDLFPPSSKERLLQVPAMAEAFKSQSWVTIGDEAVESDKFFHLIEKLIAGSETETLPFESGDACMLIQDGAVRIERDGRRDWHLVIGLKGTLAATVPERNAELRRSLSELGFAGREPEILGRLIARHRTIMERERIVETLLRTSVEGRLDAIRRTRERDTISFEDVAPPSLVGACAYLGFREGDGHADQQKAFDRLTRRIGFEEAAARHLECPVEPLPVIEKWLKCLNRKDAESIIDKWIRDNDSGVLLRNVLVLLNGMDELSQLKANVRERILACDPDVMDVQRQFALAFLHRPCAASLSEAEAGAALLAAWSWGARLSAVLRELGAERTDLGGWYMSRAQDHPARLTSFRMMDDAIHPRQVGAVELSTHVHAAILQDYGVLSDEERGEVRRRLSRDDYPFPLVTLVPDRERRNRFQTWLAGDYTAVLSLWPDVEDELRSSLVDHKGQAQRAVSIPIDLGTLSRTGLHHLEKQERRSVLQSISRQADRLTATELRFATSILQYSPAEGGEEESLTTKAFEDLARRISEKGDDEAMTLLLHAVIESAIVSNAVHWMDLLSARMRAVAMGWARLYGTRQANFLRQLMGFVSPKDRPSLARLEGELRSVDVTTSMAGST